MLTILEMYSEDMKAGFLWFTKNKRLSPRSSSRVTLPSCKFSIRMKLFLKLDKLSYKLSNVFVVPILRKEDEIIPQLYKVL